MKMKKEVFNSRRGFPTDYERGGGMTSTGKVTLIANSRGKEKTPLKIFTRGHLANGDHAVFAIHPNDVYVEVNRHRDEASVKIYKVKEISKISEERSSLVLERIFEGEYDTYSKSWIEDIKPAEFIMDATMKAIKKSCDYHCRVPYFYKMKN